MLPPRSDFQCYFWAMLRHAGAKMATKSAKMNQHRRKSGPRSTRQAHPPRGEEVSGSLIIAKAIIKLSERLEKQIEKGSTLRGIITRPCALRHGGGYIYIYIYIH